MNDLVPQEQPRRDVTHQGGNIGAVSIEIERAIAEVQGQLVLAKRFPRSMVAATLDFLDACKSPDFAATAFYAVPNRGSGPSIRFAEEVARCYGNFDYGHRELSRTEATMTSPGKSEIEVYAWDKEQNNRSTRQITVMHVLDSRSGGAKRLTDQADIDNKIANVASKQMRGRILALVPKAIVAAGIAEAKKTIAGVIAGTNEKPMAQRITGLCAGFAKYGVSTDRLAKYLGHPVDEITVDEFADLMGIGAALKDGGKASEFFPSGEVVEGDNGAAQAITAAGKKATPAPAAAKAKPAAKVAPVVSKPVEDAAPVETKGAEPDEEKSDSPPVADDQSAPEDDAEADVF